jgi:hypothetical protein
VRIQTQLHEYEGNGLAWPGHPYKLTQRGIFSSYGLHLDFQKLLGSNMFFPRSKFAKL